MEFKSAGLYLGAACKALHLYFCLTVDWTEWMFATCCRGMENVAW